MTSWQSGSDRTQSVVPVGRCRVRSRPRAHITTYLLRLKESVEVEELKENPAEVQRGPEL